jgi:hypothetical protein
MDVKEIERNLGPQPLAEILKEKGISAHDLVELSTEQLTHKMVARGCKGRRLTPNVKLKIRDALNQKSGQTYSIKDLFTYPDSYYPQTEVWRSGDFAVRCAQ